MLQGPFQGLAMRPHAQGFGEMCKRKIFLYSFFFFLKKSSKLYELPIHSSLDLPLLWLGGPLCPDVGAVSLHVLREVSPIPSCRPCHQLEPSLLRQDLKCV